LQICRALGPGTTSSSDTRWFPSGGRQTTPAFKAAYAARSGIEGTLSQGIRVCDLRQARYRRLAKTRLQEAIIATAINLLRVIAWLMEVPREYTRQSAFARLAPVGISAGHTGWG